MIYMVYFNKCVIACIKLIRNTSKESWKNYLWDRIFYLLQTALVFAQPSNVAVKK